MDGGVFLQSALPSSNVEVGSKVSRGNAKGRASENGYLDLVMPAHKARQSDAMKALRVQKVENGVLFWLQVLLPSCITAVCFVLYFLSDVRAGVGLPDSEAKGVIVISIVCFFALVDNAIFTLVIPDSYDLTVRLGGTAVRSGIVIGANKLGVALGAFFAFMVLRAWPETWRHYSRSTFWLCSLLSLVSTSSYLLVVLFEARAGEVWHRHLYPSVVVGRLVGGWGSGIRLMLGRVLIARLSTPGKRPAIQARFVFAIMFGIAMGPVMGSGARILYAKVGTAGIGFIAVGMFGVALSLCQCYAALWMLPLRDVEDQIETEESMIDFGQSEIHKRRQVMYFCLLFAFLRAFCVSGLEAGTVLILETKLGWSKDFTGLAVGAAFIAVVPLRYAYDRFKSRLTTVQWIKRMLILSVIGSLLLFHVCGVLQRTRYAHLYIPAASATLLLADALLFGSFYLSDSLSQGIILQHLLPKELSVFNVNAIILMITGLQDGTGRFLGPPLARHLIDTGGQNVYAMQQVTVLLVACATAFFGFLPLVDSGAANRPQKAAEEPESKE